MGRQEQAEKAPARAHADERALYERMALIRRFEETLLELFAAGELHGTTHTCIGQEADAVGVISCLEPERDVVVSNHRCHGHYLAFTDDVDGLLREVMGRVGGVCGGKGGSQHLFAGNFYSNGVLGSTVPLAAGIALAEREKGSGAVATVFVGDGTLGQGVVYESLNIASLWGLPLLVVVEHNGYAQSTPSGLQVAGDVEARARAFGIATSRHDTTDVLEVRRGGERGGRPRPLDGHALLPRARHVPLQPALEGRRLPRPRGDRRPAAARPADGGRGPRRRGGARGDRGRRRAARRGRRPGGARRTRSGGGGSDPMSARCGQALNAALHEIFERDERVYLIGEDLLDPYGGAFKISQGLSTRWPDRVLPTPVSEASIFGITAGLALRGYRPILEIMFGDFVALGLDQVVNGIAKFRAMFDDRVTVPLVVRTPMGARRGYGPTHSQSLEKLLVGVPGITVVTPSECHDLGALLSEAVADDEPVFFVENKVMYGRPNRRPEGGRIGELACLEGDGRYPALTFSGNGFGRADATIVTYGGMLPVVLDAATELILEHEVFTEVVALGRILPLDLEPVLESLGRTGSLVTVEEGTLTGGVGAEIAARVQAEAWSDLNGPVTRVATRDGIVPSARSLEDEALPGVEDVVAAVTALERVGG